jgi:hypothetical protein
MNLSIAGKNEGEGLTTFGVKQKMSSIQMAQLTQKNSH